MPVVTCSLHRLSRWRVRPPRISGAGEFDIQLSCLHAQLSRLHTRTTGARPQKGSWTNEASSACTRSIDRRARAGRPAQHCCLRQRRDGRSDCDVDCPGSRRRVPGTKGSQRRCDQGEVRRPVDHVHRRLGRRQPYTRDMALAKRFTKDTGIKVKVVPHPTASDASYSQLARVVLVEVDRRSTSRCSTSSGRAPSRRSSST